MGGRLEVGTGYSLGRDRSRTNLSLADAAERGAEDACRPSDRVNTAFLCLQGKPGGTKLPKKGD